MIKLNHTHSSNSKITANTDKIKNALFDKDYFEDGEFRSIPIEAISPDTGGGYSKWTLISPTSEK